MTSSVISCPLSCCPLHYTASLNFNFNSLILCPELLHLLENQSKVIAIAGTGFTNTQDMKVTLSPTMPVAYKVREGGLFSILVSSLT